MKISPSTTLTCERVYLRYIRLDDIPIIFEASQYPGFTDGMLWDPPKSEDELVSPYHNNVSAWEEESAFTFSIDTLNPKEFVGRITIRRQEGENTWNLGFWMHPKHQGNGYMTEAVQAIVRFGFTRLDAQKIVACHALWNKASEHVLKKAGFQFIRFIPQGFKKRGEWCEENLLGLTRGAWESYTHR